MLASDFFFPGIVPVSFSFCCYCYYYLMLAHKWKITQRISGWHAPNSWPIMQTVLPGRSEPCHALRVGWSNVVCNSACPINASENYHTVKNTSPFRITARTPPAMTRPLVTYGGPLPNKTGAHPKMTGFCFVGQVGLWEWGDSFLGHTVTNVLILRNGTDLARPLFPHFRESGLR